jgi:DNA invertase Pin-like site-specific DNA recombinase
MCQNEKVGYARVSSVGQNLDVQLSKLKNWGCTKIYQEKISGTTTHRQELQACIDYVREGDTLVVSRLDRLARSTLHLCTIAKILENKGVVLQVIDQSIDTSDATGRLLFNMLGTIGQFETEIRAERQADGIAKARDNGVILGRKSKLDDAQINAMREARKAGTLIKDIMKEYGLSKASVYRLLATAT